MEEPKCINCFYFQQHYVLLYQNHYSTAVCGHCTYPRIKHRKPDTLACIHFREKENDSQ